MNDREMMDKSATQDSPIRKTLSEMIDNINHAIENATNLQNAYSRIDGSLHIDSDGHIEARQEKIRDFNEIPLSEKLSVINNRIIYLDKLTAELNAKFREWL